jgi:hypothetical protein
MHNSVINIFANMDQTPSMLPHLSHDGATIGMFLKEHFEYKSFYMSRNVHPNMVMVVLRDLIETPLYKYLTITIHHQWACLFALCMNSKFQIPTYNNTSSDNSHRDNEKIHCTLIDSMIHDFLDAKKIMDYENIIFYIFPSQNFHLLSLFKDKHSKEKKFQHCLRATSIYF